jgi:hypothetical protein
MLIEFPIITTGTPARSSKRKTVVFRDEINIEIPDFPLQGSRRALTVGGRLGTHGTDYWGVDGRLFTSTQLRAPLNGRVLHSIGIDPTATILTEHLDERISDLGRQLRKNRYSTVGASLHPPELAAFFTKGLSQAARPIDLSNKASIVLPTLDELNLQDVDMEDVDRQRAKFFRHLDEFVIIDGEFKRLTPEPLYVVEVGSTPISAPKIAIALPPRDRPLRQSRQNGEAVAFFTADRYDEARAYAEEIRRAQEGETPDVLQPDRLIAVRDISYIKHDDERESLLVAAGNMLSSGFANIFGAPDKLDGTVARAKLEASSTEVLLAWKNLQAATEDLDIEAVPIAMRRCLDIVDGEGRSIFTSPVFTASVFEVVMNKWETRAVTLDLGQTVFRPA